MALLSAQKVNTEPECTATTRVHDCPMASLPCSLTAARRATSRALHLCVHRPRQPCSQARPNASPHKKRDKPLRVGGIGSGSPTADYDCTLPISLRQTNGALTKGTFTTPTLEASSDIPGLLGLEALMAENAVIDFANLKVYLCGPGGAEISPGSGAREYQGVLSPSGHLMLP